GIVKVADLGLVKLPKERGGPMVIGAGTEDPESAISGLSAFMQSEAGVALPGDGALTGVGMTVGTPAFMAPEQATNSAGVDHPAHIYSLGCTLYVLVTGRPPFEGKTAPEVLSKHLTEPVPPPDTIVKRVPKALSTILLRMLAKDPTERYQTMDAV